MASNPLPTRLAVLATTLAIAATTAVAGAAAAEPPVSQATTVAGKAQPSSKRKALRKGRSARAISIAARRRLAARQSSSGLLWEGSQLSDFVNQSAPGAVTEVPDPAGSGETVMKMDVDEQDVYPATPTENPRAQLGSPEMVHPGDEIWWHTSFYLPNDFPDFVPGWLTVMEGPYGYPWGGPPPVSLDVDEDAIRWQRNPTYDCDIPFSTPIVRGQWVDVTTHFRFGGDGWVELWINGQPITFFGPDSYNPNHEPQTTHLEMETMDYTNDGGTNFFVIGNYRMKGMFDSVTLYHGDTKVGLSKASVED